MIAKTTLLVDPVKYGNPDYVILFCTEDQQWSQFMGHWGACPSLFCVWYYLFTHTCSIMSNTAEVVFMLHMFLLVSGT